VFDTAVVVVAAVLLAAAVGGLSLLRLPPAELVHTVDGIDAVEVMVAAGRVEVSERDRAGVRVALTVRRRPGRAAPRVTVAGTRLRWRTAPRAGSFSAAPKPPPTVPNAGPARGDAA